MNFNDLVNRSQLLVEGRVSPYKHLGPVFAGIATRFADAGFPVPTRDALLYIVDTLTELKIFSEAEAESVKSAGKGLKTGRTTVRTLTLLDLLDKKKEKISSRKAEVEEALTQGLERDVRFKGTQRGKGMDFGQPTTGRTDKYSANAAARALKKRKDKSSKAADDFNLSKVSAADEAILVKITVAKVIKTIKSNLGDEGVDIDIEALEEVQDYVERKISTLDQLKSFISQIARKSEYELIAAYLADVIKPIKDAMASSKFEDEESDTAKEYDPNRADRNDDGKVEEWEEDQAERMGFKKKKRFTESTTAEYLTEQIKKDKYNKASTEASLSFTEKFKPKTSWQLQELRNYGL
jgi:hypothetical protein